MNPLRSNSQGFTVPPEIMNMYRSGGNPMQMIFNNPQMKNVAQMIQSGRNPQQLFYQMCQQMNLDPNMVLSQFKR